MKTITIANHKGGVGKSTTAVNLAFGLADQGYNVLLIDLDPQGHAGELLGVEPDPGVYDWLASDRVKFSDLIKPTGRARLHVLPGDLDTKHAQNLLNSRSAPIDYLATRLKKSLNGGAPDVIIYDTSPSVGGLQERAIFAAGLVVIPTITNYLSASAVASTLDLMADDLFATWAGSAIVVPTMHEKRASEHVATLAELRENYGDQVVGLIPKRTALEQAAAAGVSIWEHDQNCDAAAAYAEILFFIINNFIK